MALIGVLIGIAIGGIALANRGTRDTERRVDMNAFRLTLEQCKGTMGKYPTAVTNQVSLSGTTLTVGGSAYACNNIINSLNANGPALSSTLGTCATNTNAAATSTSTTFAMDLDTVNGSTFTICVKLEDGSNFKLTNS